MTTTSKGNRRAVAVAAVALALSLSSYSGTAAPIASREIPIAQLKLIYLECESRAVNGLIAAGDVMRCSVVYEDLKKRAFGGSFRRLQAWADVRSAQN